MRWILVLTLAFASYAGVRPDTITSIVLQGDRIIVSTSQGLRERTSDAKSWSVMPLPPGARPGGCLNKNDVETAQIYYSPPVSAGGEWSASYCRPGLGLWMTNDLGRIWSQVDRTHVFSSVFVHRSGIYAAGRNAEEMPHPGNASFGDGFDLLSSRDGGVSWAVIPDVRFLALTLFPCVTNPDHVCMLGSAFREYRIEFAPEPGQWPKLNRLKIELSLFAEVPDEEYLRPTTSTGTSECCYQLHASLENYSRYLFGSETWLPGIRLFTSAKQYKFRTGDRVNVHATIELMPIDPPLPLLALPDMDGTEEFWGVKYIDPEGKRVFKPDWPKWLKPGEVESLVAGATAHVLKVGQPYRKEIDLSQLMSFEKPGIYRVQLTFMNSAAFKRNQAEWTGFFSSEPFTIQITP